MTTIAKNWENGLSKSLILKGNKAMNNSMKVNKTWTLTSKYKIMA
jgi:plasmid maintenance system killer protein